MASRLAGTVVTAGEPAIAPAERAWVARGKQLVRSFGERTVLDSLDLDIFAGEFVALLGRSGSGKSTLLRAIAGLDPGVMGEITVKGTVGVAFQDARLLPWKRVLANVQLGLREQDAEATARRALAEVELADHHDAWPLTLSGGEAQRVSLARALVREPRLLLLDEPFSAVDALTRMTMHQLVLGLWERHRLAVLLVTHDVDEALLLADRVLVLDRGRVAHESQVTAERPRNRDTRELAALRARLLAELEINTKGTV